MKKYQIFVSSTFKDLIEERAAVIRIILEMNHLPAGMELFPAADIQQMGYIKQVIDECDYYILVIGGRYGSLDVDGISYTEKEYDYALETGKVVIPFLHADPGSIPVNKSDVESDVQRELTRFREKVSRSRLVAFWKDIGDLEKQVMRSLIFAFNHMPQLGWVRSDAAPSEELVSKSNDILQENYRLRELVEKKNQDDDEIVALDRKLSKEVSVTYTRDDPMSEGRKFKISVKIKDVFSGVVGRLDEWSIDEAIRKSILEILDARHIYRSDIEYASIKPFRYLFLYYGLTAEIANTGDHMLTVKGMGYFAEMCL